MFKYVITKTDRGSSQELDLRKNKLSKLDTYSYFKVDLNGEVVELNSTRDYYPISSSVMTIKSFLEGRMKTNINKGGFFNNYLSKEKFQKFIKFAKKNGQIVELDSLDTSFLETLKNLKETHDGIYNEIHDLESTFKNVDYRGKNGRYLKINYKNIIIKGKSGSYSDDYTYISDENTNITHKVKRGIYNFDSRLTECSHTYYSYYNLGGEDGFVVLKTGKKGTKKYLELQKKMTDFNREVVKIVRNYEKELF